MTGIGTAAPGGAERDGAGAAGHGAPGAGGRLFVVRHGQTPSNIAGALDTALPGAPLTELGHEQARTVGEWLVRRGARPREVHHSEALRATQTAGHVAAALGVATVVVPGAFEVQAGDFEMREDPDAVATYHRMLHEWADNGDERVGLPGGEDIVAVRERILPVIDELRTGRLESGGDAVLVIHGTLMRLASTFLGAVGPGFALRNRMPNCGVIELSHTGGAWTCHRWGDLEEPLDTRP